MNHESNSDCYRWANLSKELADAPDSCSSTLPPDLSEQAAIVLTLSSSRFYEHFLERFLEQAGRLLRMPWWGVHLLLFLATAIATVFLIDVPRVFGRGSYLALTIESLAEVLFTTWLLCHLREARAQGLLVAARISSGQARLIWLRRYLAPFSWGWILPNSRSRRKQRLAIKSAIRNPQSAMDQRLLTSAATTALGKVRCLRVWQATLLVICIFYVAELPFYDLLISAGPTDWEPYLRHLVSIYPYSAKAAMMVVVLSHFWWLSGLMNVVRGKYPSSLSSKQKLSLYFECRQAALRLSLVVGVSTGIWTLAHGFAKGVTSWSYLLSLGLAVLFTTQAAILKGLPPFPLKSIWKRTASLFTAATQVRVIYRPAEIFAVLASIACPAALNLLGAIVGKVWAG